jgi:hypothetical protein
MGVSQSYLGGKNVNLNEENIEKKHDLYIGNTKKKEKKRETKLDVVAI